jgi:hypothetical protein
MAFWLEVAKRVGWLIKDRENFEAVYERMQLLGRFEVPYQN